MRGAPAAALLIVAALVLSGCVEPWAPVETGLEPSGFIVPPLGEVNATLEPLPAQRSAYEPNPVPAFSLSWSISTVFLDGGFISLALTNIGSCEIWVYEAGFTWVGPFGASSSRDASVRILPGQTGELGILAIPPHESTGYRGYRVGAAMLAYNDWFHDQGWYDCGMMETELKEVFVHPPGVPSQYTVEAAGLEYHNNWNSLLEVDSPWVAELAANISGSESFALAAALDAYDWVVGNIQYRLDPGEGDQWSSCFDTLETGLGDCEDQAILLSALVTAMGGTARGYLIEGHAFTGVFVGNSSREAVVEELVMEHYGADLPARFIREGEYSFLVLDPAGSLYAGGLPTGAALTAGGWDFNETGILIVVEVTGETVERSFGQMLWGITCGSTVFIMIALGFGTAIGLGLVVFAFVNEAWLERRKR